MRVRTARWRAVALLALCSCFGLPVFAKPNIQKNALYPAMVNQFYCWPLRVDGGTPPYKITLAGGALPRGLSLDDKGMVNGVAEESGTFFPIFRVEDAKGQFSLDTVEFLVVPELKIVRFAVSPPDAGLMVTGKVEAEGGFPPYAYEVQSGTPPPTFRLNKNTGEAQWKADFGGVFAFVLQTTDALGYKVTLNVELRGAGLLSIDTASLPVARLGEPYKASLAGSGGTPPYRWTISSGALPSGLTLDPVEGVIAGTPQQGGFSQFVVTLSDGAKNSGQRPLLLSVAFKEPLRIVNNGIDLPIAQRGKPYSHSLTVSGGAQPVTWRLRKGYLLPPGINFDLLTGLFSGAAERTGKYPMIYEAIDQLGTMAERELIITVVEPLTLKLTSPVGGAAGSDFRAELQLENGSPPITWRLTGGSLPPGLTLDPATGIISGRPVSPGLYRFEIQVSESSGLSEAVWLELRITEPLVLELRIPDAASQGVPFDGAFTVTNAANPVVWTIGGGALPDGLSLDPSTGALRGTPKTPGAYTFLIQVTDAKGNRVSRSVTITVSSSLRLLTGAMPAGSRGVAYFFELQAEAGKPPYKWSITAGALPQGLALNPSSGAVGGTPLREETASFTVAVEDSLGQQASRSLTLAVTLPLEITTASLSDARVGQSYGALMEASGGRPPYSWRALGPLPAGLSFNAQGVISGTPDHAIWQTVGFEVRDSLGQTVTRFFELRCLEKLPSLDFLPSTIAPFPAGVPFSLAFVPSGGDGTYRFTLTGGTLPPGLTLSASGLLSGTPSEAGRYFPVITLESAGDGLRRGLILEVLPRFVLQLGSLPDSYKNESYSHQLQVEGGTPPYSFRIVTGTLPDGLTLQPGGLLTGTPRGAGSYPAVIEVTDGSGRTATQPVTFTVVEPLELPAPPRPEIVAGRPFRFEIPHTGGKQPFSYSLASGALPPGITLSPSGVLEGIANTPGLFNIVVRVIDGNGRTQLLPLPLEVQQAFTIALPAQAPPVAGRPYRADLNPPEGPSNLQWSLAGGQLPPGLTFENGVLAGTPTQPGVFVFEVQAVDPQGGIATANFQMTVNAPLSGIPDELPTGGLGKPYRAEFPARGGVPGYSWSVRGTLPPGLSLDPATGVLSGTPTAPGAFSFTVIVTDSTGATVEVDVTLDISAPALSAVSITGLPATGNPAEQVSFSLRIEQAYPADVEGTLTLTQAADRGPDDPAVQFVNGGRTLSFRIPRGDTTAIFPGRAALQTGTLAGVIAVTARFRAGSADVTPDPAPSARIRINALPPALTLAELARTAGGLELTLSGYSTPRDITSAFIRLTPAPGSTLATTEFTVDLSTTFAAYFSSATSTPFGSQFKLVIPFRIEGGGTASAAECTLTNSSGVSQSITARVP